VLSTSLEELVKNIKSSTWTPSSVLQSYAKRALQSQERINCVTEVLISDAERWAKTCNLKGPLAGVPISLKDSCAVTGYDSTIGFSGNAFKPMAKDSGLVRLLKDAGAIPFVKTAIPITLMCSSLFTLPPPYLVITNFHIQHSNQPTTYGASARTLTS
jgi:Asp-tRNA(Asn)/Glu-tRNA(Gln) amidotransferase A subunit family amidase